MYTFVEVNSGWQSSALNEASVVIQGKQFVTK